MSAKHAVGLFKQSCIKSRQQWWKTSERNASCIPKITQHGPVTSRSFFFNNRWYIMRETDS